MKLYNLKSTPTGFAIASFDEDFNLLAAYSLTPATRGSGYTCDCPANNRTVITSLCRHRKMLPLLMGAVNTNRFYNHDTGGWVELGESASGASSSEVVGTVDHTFPQLVREATGESDEGAGTPFSTQCRDESTSSPLLPPTFVVPVTSPNLKAIQDMAADGSFKVVVQRPFPAPASPSTLRRR